MAVAAAGILAVAALSVARRSPDVVRAGTPATTEPSTRARLPLEDRVLNPDAPTFRTATGMIIPVGLLRPGAAGDIARWLAETPVYDAAADRWSLLPAPPEPILPLLATGTVTWTGRDVVLVAGVLPPGETTGVVTHVAYALSPAAGDWRRIANPPAGVLRVEWVASEGLVLAWGTDDNVHAWNPDTDTWAPWRTPSYPGAGLVHWTGQELAVMGYDRTVSLSRPQGGFTTIPFPVPFVPEVTTRIGTTLVIWARDGHVAALPDPTRPWNDAPPPYATGKGKVIVPWRDAVIVWNPQGSGARYSVTTGSWSPLPAPPDLIPFGGVGLGDRLLLWGTDPRRPVLVAAEWRDDGGAPAGTAVPTTGATAAPCPPGPLAAPPEVRAGDGLVGCPEAAVTGAAQAAGWKVRVIKRDGEDLMRSMDYRPDRIDLTVDRGVVTAYEFG
jgi:hypothetical protein